MTTARSQTANWPTAEEAGTAGPPAGAVPLAGADGKVAGAVVLSRVDRLVFGAYDDKAGAVGSKKVTRLFTDLKIPESARDGILFAARKNEDKILWIPGAGHAEGFTSPLSRERFGQHGETKAEGILKITLKRRQDGN